MKNRLAKIIAVMLTLVLTLTVLVTAVFANENVVGITDEAKGINTVIYTQDWSAVNDVNSSGVRTYGKGTVLADCARFGDFANVVGAEVNGNSYLQISRDPYVNGMKADQTTAFIDLPLNDGVGSGNRINNYETQLSLKDYVIVDYDITADKWVSEDSDGNWTILSDDYTPGARASYPHLNGTMYFTAMASRYANAAGTGFTWTPGAGQSNTTSTYFNHQYGTWRVYDVKGGYFIYGGGSDQVGGWLHVSTVLDMSRVKYTAYDAEGNVLTEVTPATVAYYTMDNPTEFVSHVFVNGAHVYSAPYTTFTATETAENKYSAGTKIYPEFDTGDQATAKAATPNIALDVSRVVFTHHNSSGGEVNANMAWSIAIDNYAVTYYADAEKVPELKTAVDNVFVTAASSKNGKTFKPTVAEQSIYTTSYKAPVAASYENSAILHTSGYDQESENIDIGNAGQNLIAEVGNHPGFDRGKKDFDGDYYKVTMGKQPTANDYLSFTRDALVNKPIEADVYAGMRVGTYDGATYSLAKFDYMTVDIDIMADKYVKVGESGNWDTLVETKEDGARAAYPEGFYFSLFYRNRNTANALSANNGRFHLSTQYIDGAWYLVDNKNGAKVALPGETNVWTHITQVVDVSDERITFTFNDNGTADNKGDDYFVVNGLYDYGKVDIYVNGYYMTTWNNFFLATADGMKLQAKYDGNTPYPNIAMNDIRFNSASRAADSVASKTSHSFGIDNFSGGVYYYKGTGSLAAYAADNKAPIFENDDAIFNKNYCYTYQPAGTTVTSAANAGATLAYKKTYATQAGAFAALKEGESVYVGSTEPEFFYEIKFPFAIEIAEGAKLNWWSGGLEMGDDEFEPFEGYIIENGAFTKVLGTANNAEEIFLAVSYNDYSGDNEISYRFFTIGSTPVLLDEIDPEIVPESFESDNAFISLKFQGFDTITLEGEYDEGADLFAKYVPVAKIAPLFNLTTTTSFTSNFYVPWYATEGAEYVDVEIGGGKVRISEITVFDGTNDLSTGARFTLYKTIDGQLYKIATASPGANENRKHTYTVSFKADGVTVTQTFTIDMLTYFNKIMTGDYNDAEKALIMQAVAYVDSVMDTVAGEDKVVFDAILKNPDFAEYLVDFTEENEAFNAYIDAEAAKADVTNFIDKIAGAEFRIDISPMKSQNNKGYRPNFVIYTKEAVSQDQPFGITFSYVDKENGGKLVAQNAKWYTLTEGEGEEATVTTSFFYFDDQMPLYAYAENFVISSADDETFTGAYGLASYIAFAESAEGGEANVDAVRAFYAYAIASLNYKEMNTDMFDYSVAN